MENKNNFTGIIITVIIAVILLTVLPIINSINTECPPCEECPMPTLYAPTISISDDALTITPNPNNGAFVTGYKIYVDDVLLDTITSTTYDLSDELTEIGTYEIYVIAYATLFADSEPSNIEEYVIEPEPIGPKIFEVGDVLPATTQLRVSWISDITNLPDNSTIKSDNNNFNLVISFVSSNLSINGTIIYYQYNNTFANPYSNYDGNHAYIDIDTSTWDINKRTISGVSTGMDIFTWEDLNA